MQIMQKYLNALICKFYTFLLDKILKRLACHTYFPNKHRKVINAHKQSVFWPTLYMSSRKLYRGVDVVEIVHSILHLLIYCFPVFS